MKKKLSGIFAGLIIFGMVGMAHAAAIITLTATTPENSVGGYLPGTLVDFQVDISQDTYSPIGLRLAQLDFSASDPDLTFLGDFSFDFSTLSANIFYVNFPSYPLPQTVYTSSASVPGFILEVPISGSLTLGTGSLELPASPGSYLLDALNAGTSDIYSGAQINFDFVNPTRWSSRDGSISGDSLTLKVVPVPSALVLFSTSLLTLAGIRKRLKKR